MDRPLEQTTMRKLYRRLLPFAILAYFLCYLVASVRQFERIC